MKVTAKINYKKTEELRQLIWNKSFAKRDKIHRSDLVHCLLKIFCRELGIPAKPGEQTVEAWIIGETGHLIIEPHFEKQEFEVNGPGPLSDIPAHIDGIWEDKGAEIKTSVHQMYLPSHIQPYIEDITSGFAFLKQKEGYLITLSLIDKMLLVWDIKMDDQTVSDLISKLNFRKDLVRQAVREKNFELLEPKADECPYCQYNWMTQTEVGCPYSTKSK